MAKVANYSDLVLRAVLRDVADTPLGFIWCGRHVDRALATVSEQAPVRSWNLTRDDHEHWHAYIVMRNGITHHGIGPDTDCALRAALGELLNAEVEV